MLDVAEDAYTSIILRGPILAIASSKIEVKEGRLTFDWGSNMLNLVCSRTMNHLILFFLLVDVIRLFMISLWS